MKLKKLNAALGLLSIVFLLAHVVYSVVSYLTFYYNPSITTALSLPFLVLVCLHAMAGMLRVFLLPDGTRTDLYPKQNMGTILERISAALILPLLILHTRSFSIMQSNAESGNAPLIALVMLVEVLFFAVVITHVATSLTKGLVTLGFLSSPQTQAKLDRVVYILCAICFAVAVYAVTSTRIAMFFAG